jgi:nucleoside-diphosphate-sugar epimerase
MVLNIRGLVVKNLLVTGGAGFLGSHLCEKLLEYGHNVICVDNLLTGRKENKLSTQITLWPYSNNFSQR